MQFDSRGDARSCISETGENSIRAINIDDVIDENERVTFIKMDVEGSELESLKGAKKTILRDKPKLAICIYHKPEDMIELPLFYMQCCHDFF